jgi:hypothetical protein
MSTRYWLFRAFSMVLVFGLGALSTAHAQYSSAAVSLVNAGNQAFVGKDYGSALLDYQAATYSDSTCGPAYQGIGNSLCQLGRYSGALSAYESAQRLKPGDTRLAKVIAQLNAKLGLATPTPEAAISGSTLPPPPSEVSPQPPAATSSDNLPPGPPAVPTPVQAVLSSPTPSPSSTAVVGAAQPTVAGTPSGDGGRFALIPQGGGAGSVGNPFGVGISGGIGAGYFLSDDFCLETNFNFYLFKDIAPIVSPNTTGLANIVESSLEATLGFKYRLSPGAIRPYLMAGGGISYLLTAASASGTYQGNTFSASNPTLGIVAPLVQVGAGFEFTADTHSSFFAQIQCDMVFNNKEISTVTSQNFTATLSTGGGVLVYLPVQVGFNFYL